MSFKEQVIKKLANTPDFLLGEIAHLIQFLKHKYL